MASTPNFNWSTPDNTGLVKNGALDIRTLGNAIDASMADLKGGTTGQVLSKNSNTDMDFTWVAQDDSNAIQNAIVDAKGDLIAATAADTPARLAVGTNGQILTADSTAATGLKWATPAGSAAVGCLVFSPGTSFSYTSGAVTVIPMGSELWDTDGFHSTSTNTSRITIPSGKAGKYQINGYIRTNTTASNYAIINLLKNGSSVTASGLEGGQMVRLSPNGNTYAMSGIAILDLAVGDYIEIAYQADTSTGTYSMYSQFGVVYLGA